MSKDRDSNIAACIWAVPKGNVASYGQIADLAGIKRGHRVVCRFLREQDDPELPWYRILRADGKIGMEPDSEGYHAQVEHLKNEGVLVINHKIDMKRYQWQPGLDFILFHPDL